MWDTYFFGGFHSHRHGLCALFGLVRMKNPRKETHMKLPKSELRTFLLEPLEMNKPSLNRIHWTGVTFSFKHSPTKTTKSRWCFPIFFYFQPYLGKWSNFDSYFSKGLVQPPTRLNVSEYIHTWHRLPCGILKNHPFSSPGRRLFRVEFVVGDERNYYPVKTWGWWGWPWNKDPY